MTGSPSARPWSVSLFEGVGLSLPGNASGAASVTHETGVEVSHSLALPLLPAGAEVFGQAARTSAFGGATDATGYRALAGLRWRW